MTLAVASLARERLAAPAALGARPRIAVLVPAHDEELLVGRCVRSLLDQSYPEGGCEVVVIADNCTDDTAAVAKAAGARVLVRHEPGLRGKGRALRWAMDLMLAEPAPPDAFVVVDADSVADRGLVAGLAAAYTAGHDVVQGEYTLLEESGPEMVGVGFLLFHRVRFRGRARLGMAANLVGNGMLMSSRVLRRHPWNAFTGVEDLEYSIALRRAGVRPFFASSARVAGPPAASGSGAVRQRMRWEGGRFHVTRTQLGPLLAGAIARRDPGLLDAALDLATPPLSALTATVVAGCGVAGALWAFGLIDGWAVGPWAVALAAVPAFVVIGVLSAGASARLWPVLLGAPRFVAWKLVTYARLARGHDVHGWDRTDRVAL